VTGEKPPRGLAADELAIHLKAALAHWRDDAWLATWSRADGVVPHPVDPLRLPAAVATLLRTPTSTSTDVVPVGPA
jgi:hypothetical protein